ncbi:hypothetical protein [Campylobacter hyointestinalis]|uniref:hypothetical protein n=1 Tax=Campylobacter hyointestinalis TaxID=198 RepID=UPI0025529C9D|nr:hypothetical protein [Campylobacter hyointestinalis]MDL2346630.1 hypothetical protein [Campylobacter hyointestinalis]MDL2348759.1 hypothetical protein [Campylobacter hyointestinalis]MDL2350115.1 hypothetical protein [Campylobacter hyointestinalis]MDM1026336.1 hypothetical protein [Campylobacter hyointestinalis]MDM1027510.1 hypothetical protein [Campylobacter hyointestinalis]
MQDLYKFNPAQEQNNTHKETNKSNLGKIMEEKFLKALSDTTKDMMNKNIASKEKQYTRDNHSSDRNI